MSRSVVRYPSLSWTRKEKLAVLLLSIYLVLTSNRRGPRFLGIQRLNRALHRFSPWQIITVTLSLKYALSNFDKLLGLDAPNYARQLYAHDYSHAAWIVTGLDAGFATAMSIRPKWLRDICSIVFTAYYVFHHEAAEKKIHRLRELCTLDFLRVTWNKSSNPYLRIISVPFRPSLAIYRKLTISRPKHSVHTRPITAWLFFVGSEEELHRTTELVIDFPGGGFVAMDPTHHEERLRSWATRLKRPVLSLDYGKAPDYPYPFAIEEGFDFYCALSETKGQVIGMSGRKFGAILSGDSAGGNIAINVMFKIHENISNLQSSSYAVAVRPTGLALTYAAMNFSFASWAWPSSPTPSPSSITLSDSAGGVNYPKKTPSFLATSALSPMEVVLGSLDKEKRKIGVGYMNAEEESEFENEFIEEHTPKKTVVYQQAHTSLFERQQVVRKARGPDLPRTPSAMTRLDEIARTRMTMSSKAGYIHDPIITPSMMWSMCLLYLGPNFTPGVERDYHLSPLLAPSDILAALPPLLLQCGARDPLVDDTILFAARVRRAKKVAAKNSSINSAGSSRISSPPVLCQPTPPEEEDIGNDSSEDPNGEAQRYTSGRRRRENNDEGDKEESDVLVQIFPGWSHGYLQMTPLMRGAQVAIDDIADWMDKTFAKAVHASESEGEKY